MYAAIVATGLFIGLQIFTIGYVDIRATMNNWSERRCDIDAMTFAMLQKPKDDPRTPFQFASDNFTFCVKKIAKLSLNLGMAPLWKVLGQTLRAFDVFNPILNSLRNILRNAMGTFSMFMDQQWRRQKSILSEVVQNFHKIAMSTKRMWGMGTAIVQLGLSLQALLLNGIKFAVIAALILVGILAALVIILWFALIPTLPLIFAVIVVIAVAVTLMVAESGVDGGTTGAFCVDPNAEVILADGSTKPLREIRQGDLLPPKPGEMTPNVVTGLLWVEATNEPLTRIEGIRMSATHRVWYDGQWLLAREVPEGTDGGKIGRLICLNTTHHWVPLRGQTTTVVVSDWEEVSSEAGRKEWIAAVVEALGGAKANQVPHCPPIFSADVQVLHQQKGWIPARSVTIGDFIFGSNQTWTRVTGLQFGQMRAERVPKDMQWVSNGVWALDGDRQRLQSEGLKGIDTETPGKTLYGMSLITEAEEFMIAKGNARFIVRDFTELGASRLEDTQDFLGEAMNQSS